MSTYILSKSESQPPLPPGSSVMSNQQNIACQTAHSNIHWQTNNHACEPEVNITSNHHAKEAFFASCAHASKNTAQSWDASPKLTKYRSETTPQAVHVYVHTVKTGITTAVTTRIIRDIQPPKQSRAIHHIQISIGKRRTMHVNQKSISRQIITQKKLFASCAHAKQKTQLSRGPPHQGNQIQIRDDTTSRACLRTFCYRNHNRRYHKDHQCGFKPPKTSLCHRTFKYPSRLTTACEPEVNITSIITACGARE